MRLATTARAGITAGGDCEKRYHDWQRLREPATRLVAEKRIAVAAREKPNQSLQQTPPHDGIG
ncbi:MAG: hypothetical protein LC104_17185 [Bacteroidales bacterium]|nr:hypothetical protein [Bacteroidales bacterium]